MLKSGEYAVFKYFCDNIHCMQSTVIWIHLCLNAQYSHNIYSFQLEQGDNSSGGKRSKFIQLTSSPASAEACPALPPPAPQQPAHHTHCVAHSTGMISSTDTSVSVPPHASTHWFSEGAETTRVKQGFVFLDIETKIIINHKLTIQHLLILVNVNLYTCLLLIHFYTTLKFYF